MSESRPSDDVCGDDAITTTVPLDWGGNGHGPRKRLDPPGELPLSLPGRFSDLEILEYIGGGGMGEVWMARSREELLDQPLAIKFITHPQLQEMPGLIDQFHDECSAGISINHRFVVRTHKFLNLSSYTDQGWPPAALLMSRHEAALNTVLADLEGSNEVLPPELAMEFGRNIVEALQYLHSHGRAHRDLKPGNVLIELQAENQPYTGLGSLAGAAAMLSDLGVSCATGKVPRFPLGQDGYKAPELFHGQGGQHIEDRPVDQKEDIYGLGCVLEAMANAMDDPKGWIENVIRDCKDPDPDRRPVADTQLILRLSPDWLIQDFMVRGGWKPEAHPHFVGRQFVFDAFDEFRESRPDRGGVFLIEGDAGVGKTALLTQWAGKDGPHPAYFFRQAEGRTSPQMMLETLFDALAKRYALDETRPEKPETYKDALEGLLKRISGECLRKRERVLILVDGLDEAENPLRAAQLLPKDPLPCGVFFIVSSRPAAGKEDHLGPLLGAGARHFALRSDDKLNLGDVQAYVRNQLGEALPAGQGEALTKATGGIFLLAIFLVEQLTQKNLTISEAMDMAQGWEGIPQADRIFTWYKGSWQRATGGLGRDERQDLVDVLCLMAAAQAPLGETQVIEILRWDGAVLDWTLERLRWFLLRKIQAADGYEQAYLQLRHQSVRDFLVSVKYRGPARHGLKKMHARVADHYLREAEPKGWLSLGPYPRFFAVRHMLQADTPEHLERAAQCLTDLDYLQATLGDGTEGSEVVG